MRLSSHCFSITGLYFIPPWSVNAGFIIGRDKTLIIDSGSSLLCAQTIYGYAEIAAPGNKMILINTEGHLDHVGGNGFFKEKGIPVFGHHFINRNQGELLAFINGIDSLLILNPVRKNEKEGGISFKGTQICNPDHFIKSDLEMDLGDSLVRVILSPGHTKTNLCVYHQKDRVLFCGDTVLPDFIPNLEEGNAVVWKQWLDSLEKIRGFEVEILVPGHGNVILGQKNIFKEIERIQNFLLKAINKNMAPTAVEK